MKKLLITLTLVLISSIAFAQPTPEQQRKAREKIAKARFDTSMVRAIESGSFTFTAENVSVNLGDNYPINGPYTIFFITPFEMKVLLPYYTATQPIEVAPMAIDFSTAEYKYSFRERGGMYYVKVAVNNVTNNQETDKVQNGRYVFNFEISPITGNTFLTVTPNYNATINYTGFVRPNAQ